MTFTENPEIITERDVEIADPEFVGMAWPEITAVIDQQAEDEWLDQQEREYHAWTRYREWWA